MNATGILAINTASYINLISMATIATADKCERIHD